MLGSPGSGFLLCPTSDSYSAKGSSLGHAQAAQMDCRYKEYTPKFCHSIILQSSLSLWWMEELVSNSREISRWRWWCSDRSSLGICFGGFLVWYGFWLLGPALMLLNLPPLLGYNCGPLNSQENDSLQTPIQSLLKWASLIPQKETKAVAAFPLKENFKWLTKALTVMKRRWVWLRTMIVQDHYE